MSKLAWPALGVFVLACFWGFWSYGPFDLDEGLYAVASMEMQERGDWVVPTYRGVPFFEKPILFYWTARVAEMAVVSGVAALRLPSILATIGTLILVALFTRRIGAVMILSVSVLFMGVGRMFMPDPFLILGMTAALFAFWKGRSDPRWFVAVGAGLAVAVLAKGPMPLVVFGLLALYRRVRMEGRPPGTPMVSGWKVGGVLVFLVMAVPWYVLAAMRSPVFVEEFIVKQNLGRLAGGDVAHAGPIWLYVPVVLVGLLPFSLSLVGAWRKREGELEQYLWAFVWIVFVLFSFAGTKLPHYILPIFPALAVLVERYHAKSPEKKLFVYPISVLVITVSLFVYGLILEDDGSFEIMALKLAYYLFMLGWMVSIFIVKYTRGSAGLAGFAAVASFALLGLAALPRFYWVTTHLDPALAAKVADAQGLPIVEYRTGGEKQRGKTSHPSMQWTIGKNTIAVEDYMQLRQIVRDGRVAVITRDGRFRKDLGQVSSPQMRAELLTRIGDFEVYVVSPLPENRR